MPYFKTNAFIMSLTELNSTYANPRLYALAFFTISTYFIDNSYLKMVLLLSKYYVTSFSVTLKCRFSIYKTKFLLYSSF